MPNSILFLKATCNEVIKWKIPGVVIINGLLNDSDIDIIHNTGHCYVSFSNSEGVGMGAVEAAARDKPVILTEFGGATEYIKTPYTIKCERKFIGYNDFLFTSNLEWGKPNVEQLYEFMRDAYNKKLTYMDHQHTRDFVNPEKIKGLFDDACTNHCTQQD
jgi:glycosyltransferase involved in cell wall biosynthesis